MYEDKFRAMEMQYNSNINKKRISNYITRSPMRDPNAPISLENFREKVFYEYKNQ